MNYFLLFFSIALLFACSDAKLYHQKKIPFHADRISLKGKVCTAIDHIPTKVLFLLDQAPGPLYESYDPGLERLNKISNFIQSGLAKTDYEFALISYAGRARKLAPVSLQAISENNDGAIEQEKLTFTRDAGRLLGAVSQLSLSGSCVDDLKCRNPLDALRAAQSLIEDDLSLIEAGLRAKTRYVILWGVAGMASPMAAESACCLPQDEACLNAEGKDLPSFRCQNQLELQAVQDLKNAILSQGVSSFEINIFQLEQGQAAAIPELAFSKNLLQMSFVGLGRFARFANVSLLDFRQIFDFNQMPTLFPSIFTAVNQNAAPRADGLISDSDQDGLSDDEELNLKSSPILADTDEDFVGDLLEAKLGESLVKTTEYELCQSLVIDQTIALDRDFDGLNECEERLLGTDPSLSDSDGDGLVDGLEFKRGTDYLHADSAFDFDQDGISNVDEIRENTDPRSIDQLGRLGLASRYEIEYEGEKEILTAKALNKLEGIRITAIQNSIAGVHQFKWQPASGQKKAKLSWLRVGDGDFKSEVEIPKNGTYLIYYGQQSKDTSRNPTNEDEFLKIEINMNLLPKAQTIEELLIVEENQNCIVYTVNNIRLVQTQPLKGDHHPVGLNEIYLYLSQDNASVNPNQPNSFRIARIPIRYEAPDQRSPNLPQLIVEDGEFISPLLTPID